MDGDDEGSLIPLIAFYVVVAATLILVVAGASKVYLARRSLQSAADGAALASAQQVSTAGLYAGDGSSGLQLEGDVCQAAADYARANHLDMQFDGLRLRAWAGNDPAQCDADAAADVTVRAQANVTLPLVNILGKIDERWANGVPVDVRAHAALRCDGC